MAWTLADGNVEAFWNEDGLRHTFYFAPDGTQIRTLAQKYKLIRSTY